MRAPEDVVLIASSSQVQRRVVSGVLQHYGYTTREVFNSFEAESALAHHGEHGVLLIEETGLRPPQLERWQPLLDARPELPVIVVSSEAEARTAPLPARAQARIDDPFDVHAVIVQVRAALRTPQAA